MTFEELKKEQFAADPVVKKEYGDMKNEFAVVQAIAWAQAERGMTFEEIAVHCGLSPSRVEELAFGEGDPTLSELKQLADALGMKLVIRFQSPVDRDRP